ncbi:hypothetical protein [Paenibacillus ferrarius]|uniref:hypothetical protein n=1 Tax=Paenibacillus ferrarius TaxID=1469647 RepID=UPI003D272957
MDDLWGELELEDQASSDFMGILREQAELLEIKTNFVLQARLQKINLMSNTRGNFTMAINFNVISPRLENYTYTLFSLYFTPEIDYPVGIDYKSEDFGTAAFDYFCETEDELIECLRDLFSQRKVKSTINSLYNKSRNL